MQLQIKTSESNQRFEMSSSILIPLRANIKSFQKWGDTYDISGRIKQSMVLYDEVIVETGTFKYSGSDRFAFQEFKQWDRDNTKEDVLREIERIEKEPDKTYITVIDGKTRVEKYKYEVSKKQKFVSDYRTVEVISEIESGSFGKELDFLKYAYIMRKENHKETISQNTLRDLANKRFAETARRTYGNMNLVGLLNNLNDSLALSHLFKMPVCVDVIHAPLLRTKTECDVHLDFEILNKLSNTVIPDFSVFELDKLIELRRDNALRSFRDMIRKINSKLQSEGSLKIEDLIKQELLNEIAEIAPTKKKFVLDTSLGVLSFIPHPLVSIATAITDIGKELKEYRDFTTNWLSFVLKARELGGF